MLNIHPNALTTPITRAEIVRSDKPCGVLARRYGVSTEAVHKWRKRRDAPKRLDRSARPTSCFRRRARRNALWSAPCGMPQLRHQRPHLCPAPISATLKPQQHLTHPVSERLNHRLKPFTDRPAKGCGTATATDASVTCSLPSTAGLIGRILRSKTMRPRRTPSPSCTAQPRPSPSASPTCWDHVPPRGVGAVYLGGVGYVIRLPGAAGWWLDHHAAVRWFPGSCSGRAAWLTRRSAPAAGRRSDA